MTQPLGFGPPIPITSREWFWKLSSYRVRTCFMGWIFQLKKKWLNGMNKWKSTPTCCSFVAQLNCKKNAKQWIPNRSYFKIFHQPRLPVAICLARISHPLKRFSQHFSKLWHTKKNIVIRFTQNQVWKQTLQQDLSNFHGFLENKTIYIRISLWGLHGYYMG